MLDSNEREILMKRMGDWTWEVVGMWTFELITLKLKFAFKFKMEF